MLSKRHGTLTEDIIGLISDLIGSYPWKVAFVMLDLIHKAFDLLISNLIVDVSNLSLIESIKGIIVSWSRLVGVLLDLLGAVNLTLVYAGVSQVRVKHFLKKQLACERSLRI